ncbi:MAG: NUDIX hydrolase [Chloroflexi bacterium]|nr:NUDIX hydrolase [Chloroflexota bacterium]
MGRKNSAGGRRPRVEEPVSSGGVVYQWVDGQLEVVLCGRDEPVRWSLAKGTPDPGETLEETALREVQEETGLVPVIEDRIRSIDYWFSDKDSEVRFHKTVHFYLMKCTGGDVSLHDPEFDVVEWFPYEKAVASLAYPNEADVLRQAFNLITQKERAV